MRKEAVAMEMLGTDSRPVSCTNMEPSGTWDRAGVTRPWTDARWPRTASGRPVTATSISASPTSQTSCQAGRFMGWVFCWLGILLLSCFRVYFFPCSSKIDALALQAVICLQEEKCIKRALVSVWFVSVREGGRSWAVMKGRKRPRSPGARGELCGS